MKFKLFYLFYVLALLLIALGFIIGLWPFFVVAAIASILSGVAYHLFFNSGRKINDAFLAIHFTLVVIGLPLTLNLYRVFTILTDSGAPDTMSVSGGIMFFSGPVLLLAALIVFIIALSTSKKSITDSNY